MNLPYKPTNKSINLLMSEVEEAIISSKLKQKTEMFWLLQLQFMETTPFHLAGIMESLHYSRLYKKNRHSSYVQNIANKVTYKGGWAITEDEHYCLATHIALQLAGVEE